MAFRIEKGSGKNYLYHIYEISTFIYPNPTIDRQTDRQRERKKDRQRTNGERDRIIRFLSLQNIFYKIHRLASTLNRSLPLERID